MRRTIVYVAAWFAAGVGAVVLASAGVSMVGNQVTGSRPSPLSADEVGRELAAQGTTTTTSPGATTSVPGEEASTTTTTSVPPATSATSQPTGDAPPTTAGTAAPEETRTYALTGGTATLHFAPSGVTVVVASPNSGYSVEVEPTHDNGIRVEFRSEDHRSRVEGWWDGGPRDEVEEQDDGG